MRIALISSEESITNPLSGLNSFLNEQIINVEVEEITVPMNLDIIAAVNELEDYNLIFVFVSYAKEDAKIKLLLEKLVELEIQKGIKIIKAVELSEEEGGEAEPETIAETADPLVQKWGNFILKELFGEEKEVK